MSDASSVSDDVVTVSTPPTEIPRTESGEGLDPLPPAPGATGRQGAEAQGKEQRGRARPAVARVAATDVDVRVQGVATVGRDRPGGGARTARRRRHSRGAGHRR